MNEPISSERLRKERLAAALAERKRRDDLGIQLNKDRQWFDTSTNELLTDEQILKREIAFEKAKPPKVDLDNKVIVDRAWLRSAVSVEVYDEARARGHIKNVRDWL